jgi:hypothetical protein
MSMAVQIPGAPASIVAAIEKLKDELVRTAGKNLVGLILYGGLARGRYRPGKSDVNVVVLLEDASAPALVAVAPALRTAWRAAGVDPLVLTPAEVPRAAEAFPTKFLDIKQHHIVLMGTNPFAGLEVTREQMRRRAEQELRNMLLRLRHRYIASGGDAAVLTRALARTARPLALELQALLQVAGKPLPAEDRTGAIFEAAATAFGMEREPLARLGELRQASRLEGDAIVLYHDVLAALARAAALADQLKEAPR